MQPLPEARRDQLLPARPRRHAAEMRQAPVHGGPPLTQSDLTDPYARLPPADRNVSAIAPVNVRSAKRPRSEIVLVPLSTHHRAAAYHRAATTAPRYGYRAERPLPRACPL
ncbi:hypothetical protein GCM10020218_052880 [Dactylosporangium vinaceum]